MTELKPCPFCGRIPKVEDCGTNRFFVKCECGIAQDKLYFQRCDAVRRWNTRRQQPERKTGKWIPHKSVFDGLDEPVYTCDQCGYNIGFHRENFCPHCGASMAQKGEDNDRA